MLDRVIAIDSHCHQASQGHFFDENICILFQAEINLVSVHLNNIHLFAGVAHTRRTIIRIMIQQMADIYLYFLWNRSVLVKILLSTAIVHVAQLRCMFLHKSIYVPDSQLPLNQKNSCILHLQSNLGLQIHVYRPIIQQKNEILCIWEWRAWIH